MKVKFLDLKAQYETIKEEIQKEINWVLENTSFILGDKVKEFEKNFAFYCNKKYAVAVNSGTSALHLALLCYGIKEGDEILVPVNTFIATAESVSYTGAKPVFVDMDSKDFCMNPEKIQEKITARTKAIIPVHLYGQSAEMDKIIEIAKRNNLIIIEDCCQAHGAEYNGKKVPVTETGCFSFYPGKNLGAYGEAGAILTDNEQVAEKARMLRDHGQKEKYNHKYIGYNYRMTGFQGAILNVKLRHLNEWIRLRREKAALYSSLLNGAFGVEIPKEQEYAKHVYHLYVIRTRERDKLAEHLKNKEIDTGMHYPIPLHLQEAYSFLWHKAGDFPAAEQAAKEILSLPMFPELTEEQIRYVADAIKEFGSGTLHLNC